MNNKYRKDLKEQIMHYALGIETNDIDEELNKCELNLRLLKFFQYEQNPEFET